MIDTSFNKQTKLHNLKAHNVTQTLLEWYSLNRRDLPWREHHANPWHIVLSEIMAQQTQIVTMLAYFDYFTKRWPTPADMAKDTLDNVLAAWSGLGYYRRAHNLYKMSQQIVERFEGEVPDNEKDLLTLPGIGEYTAAAIVAIAFNKQAFAIDTNIARIITRLYAIQTPLSKAKSQIKDLMYPMLPKNISDFIQALMDFGALICTAQNPKCSQCNLAHFCSAQLSPKFAVEHFPIVAKKRPRKILYTSALVAIENNKIALIKRPDSGLLASMWSFPDNDWNATPSGVPVLFENIGKQPIKDIKHQIKHVFTHIELNIDLYILTSDKHIEIPINWRWFDLPIPSHYPISSLTKKIATYVKQTYFK